MSDSVVGILLVCGLALFAIAWAGFACATATRELRCRRRRSRLRLVAGAGSGATQAQPRARGRDARALRSRGDGPVRGPWDSVPVTQWEPPRERDAGPSPAA